MNSSPSNSATDDFAPIGEASPIPVPGISAASAPAKGNVMESSILGGRVYGNPRHLFRHLSIHLGIRLDIRLLLLSLLCIVLVGGCSNPFQRDDRGDEQRGDQRTQRERSAALLGNVEMLNVDMYDSYYGANDTNLTEPPVWTVKSGADIVVNLVNHGLLDHNWAVVKKGVTVPVPYEEGQAGDILLHGIGMVYNNSQTTITFTAPESGEYQVICTVSGHYPFMQGKLRVTEAE